MQNKFLRFLAPLFVLCVVFSAHAAETGASALELVGKGIRTKTVVFFNVNVYEAQFLVSDKPAFMSSLKSGTPMAALAKTDKAELRLKFLRNVSAGKIETSFRDGLEANKISPKTPNMKAFLKVIEDSPEFDEGKTVVLTGNIKEGTIVYTDTAGKATTMKVGTADVLNLFSIWFGTPADGGLEKLKSALLGKAE